jgi:ABC-type glycerol-3-phosphate transport system substrate-binding protein
LYSITSASKHEDEAWKLVQFLGGKDATGEYYVPTKWALDYGLGFAYTSMYKDPAIRTSLQSWINPDILSEQAKYEINRSYRFTPYFSDWQTSEWGDMQNLLTGSGSMDDLLNQMSKHWNDLKAQYGG